MQEIPLALRFIVKAAAFMAHHQHLKPTENFHFFLEIPMDWLLRIHTFIGIVLTLLLIEITVRWGIAIGKKLWKKSQNIIKWGIAIGKKLWKKVKI